MHLDLDQLPWQPTRRRGLSLHPLYRNAETNDAVVLIRMEPGTTYPPHRHVGEEHVLVLHGGYRDEHGTFVAGQRAVHPAGSSHAPVALEGTEPCILLAVAYGGTELR